jgi:uncharacterized protein YcfJ
MNTLTMNTTTNATIGRMILTVVVLSLVLTATSAEAAGYAYKNRQSSNAVYDYARVLSSEPIIRYVTVTTPVKECWEETEYYRVNERRPGLVGRTIFGAVLGGVIGHQFGSGRGNDMATIAGTLIGASIAKDTAIRKAGYGSREYSRPVTRCKTNYQSHEEERIDGYRVIYSYHGQKYATNTPEDPGKRLRIRVDVRPAP